MNLFDQLNSETAKAGRAAVVSTMQEAADHWSRYIERMLDDAQRLGLGDPILQLMIAPADLPSADHNARGYLFANGVVCWCTIQRTYDLVNERHGLAMARECVQAHLHPDGSGYVPKPTFQLEAKGTA